MESRLTKTTTSVNPVHVSSQGPLARLQKNQRYSCKGHGNRILRKFRTISQRSANWSEAGVEINMSRYSNKKHRVKYLNCSIGNCPWGDFIIHLKFWCDIAFRYFFSGLGELGGLRRGFVFTFWFAVICRWGWRREDTLEYLGRRTEKKMRRKAQQLIQRTLTRR